MLNAIGLANPGRDAFVAEVLPALRTRARRPDLGLGRRVLGRATTRRRARSCRTEEVACDRAQPLLPERRRGAESAAEIVAACRAATALPLYAKLSPHAWDIGETVRAVEAAGADGISLVNTLRGLALDARLAPRARARQPAATRAPRSSPSRSLRFTPRAARRRCRSSAWAGVSTGRDALELIACGANARRARHGVVRRPRRAATRARESSTTRCATPVYATTDDAFCAAHATVASSRQLRSTGRCCRRAARLVGC